MSLSNTAKAMFPLEKGDNPLEKHPVLASHVEFKSIPNPILHFIFLLYDFNFQKTLKGKDYEEKQKLVADHVGVSDSQLVAINGTSDSREFSARISGAVARFLRIQDSRKWALYCNFSDQFYQLIQSTRNPIDDQLDDDKKERAYDTRTKVRDSMTKLALELDKLEAELFLDPKAAKVVSNVVERISPEAMAKSTQNGTH